MKSKDVGHAVSLDELPLYYDFIENLFSNELDFIRKDKQSVLREFDIDKWGALYKHFSAELDTLDVIQLDAFLRKDKSRIYPIWNGQGFVLENNQGVANRLHQLYHQVLKSFCNGALSFVELGAGYGANFFKLIEKEPFSSLELYAGELSTYGVKLINTIAKNRDIDVRAFQCDIYNGAMDSKLDIKKALIYTSFSMCYQEYLDDEFINYIKKMDPEIVVHFEPVYEYCSNESMYEMLIKKYIEVNGYTKNFLSVLKEAEKKNQIRIVTERKNILGTNPFLPLSVVAWEPA